VDPLNELCFSTLNHSPLLASGTSIERQVAAAQAAGFPTLELDVFSLRGRDTPIDLQGLRCVGLAGLNVYDDEAQSEAEAASVLTMCAHYRPEWLLVRLAGDGRANVTTLRRHLPAFVELGVGIALEPSPFTSVRTLRDGLDVLDELHELRDHPHGLIPDSWHFFATGADWAALASLPLERLAYAQVDDALPPSDDRQFDTMNRRGLPGEGSLDLARFVRALEAKHYTGVLSFEVLSASWRERPVEEFANALYAAIERHLH
jgi:sugar phosphate isomerase/epimerase